MRDLIKCTCGYVFSIGEQDRLFRKDFHCANCKQDKCISCFEKPHPGQQCDLNKKIQLLKDLKGVQDEAGNIVLSRACPYCGEIWQKDDHCEHVKCTKCQKDFNFCCGSKRSPSFEHGLHYHRPSCRFYDKEYATILKSGKEKEKFNQKCAECQELLKTDPKAEKNQIPCQMPLDLYQDVYPPELLSEDLLDEFIKESQDKK